MVRELRHLEGGRRRCREDARGRLGVIALKEKRMVKRFFGAMDELPPVESPEGSADLPGRSPGAVGALAVT